MSASHSLTEGLRYASFEPKGNGQTVVVLIGWWMAKPKHLQKYVRIWDQKGVSTLHFCPEDYPFFKFKTSARRIVRNLKRHLSDDRTKETTIIFHVFSNNGCKCLLEILKQAQHEIRVFRAITGVILDSCPGYLSPVSGYGAVMEATKKIAWKHNLFRGMFFGLPLTALYVLFTKFRRPFSTGATFLVLAYIAMYYQNRSYRNKFHKALSNLPNCCGELFLYSQSDKLCTKDIIDRAAFEREERRSGVSKVCFEKSPHVAHYLKYPRRYEETCWKFLEQVLKKG